MRNSLKIDSNKTLKKFPLRLIRFNKKLFLSRVVFFLSFLFLQQPVFSQSLLEFRKQEDYKSGRVLCLENSSKLKNEIAFWVSVPKFYNQPNQGNTEIYAYTLKPLNYQFPTLLFFMGGPGSSSRTIPIDLPETNILYFEPRGVSCSRPALVEDFYNPTFYSSEAISRDAHEILKFLNLSSVSVYGHSYGTIAATKFASQFPEHTRNLILEGVMSRADQSLIQSSLKQQYLQQLFDSLDNIMQNQIITLGSKMAPANWFSKIGSMMLYLNDGIDSYKRFLNVVLNSDEENIKRAINYFYYEGEDDPLYFSRVTLGMLSCQETSVTEKDLSTYLVFDEKRKLYYDRESSFSDKYCKPLNITHPRGDVYLATQYPVQVPVFYLLGETDGATDLDQGLYHYQHVPQKERYLMIMKQGGHLPSLGFLKDNRPCDVKKKNNRCDALKPNQLQTEIFNTIVHSSTLDYSRIAEFNRISSHPWVVY